MPIHPKFRYPGVDNPDFLTEPQTGAYIENGQAPTYSRTGTQPSPDRPPPDEQPPQVQASNDQIMQYLLNRKRMADITSPQAMQDQTPFRKPVSLGADIGVKTPPMLQSYSMPDYGVGAGHLPTQDPNFGMGLGVDLYGGESLPEAPTMATPQGSPTQSPPELDISALETPETKGSTPPFQFQPMDTSRGRNREMLAALAEAAGRVGNVGGVAQKTTAYDFADRLGKAESGEAEMNQQMNLFKLNEAQRGNELAMRKKDKNSAESISARKWYNQQYGKYGMIPESATAEMVEKFMPFAAKKWEKEAGQLNQESFLRIQTQLQMEAKKWEMEAQFGRDENRANAQIRLEEIKHANDTFLKKMELEARLKQNENDAAARAELAKINHEFQMLMAKLGFENTKVLQQGAQATQKEIAAGNRASAKALKDADLSSKRESEQNKLALENQELAINGYQLVGNIRPKPEVAGKLRDKQSALKTMSDAASEMQRVIKGNPLSSKFGKFTTAGQDLARLQAKILTDYNTKFAGLGALSGPDKQLLDEVSSSSFATIVLSSPETAAKQIEKFKGMLRSQFESDMAANGYVRGGTAAPPGNAAPASGGRKVWRKP